MLQNPCKTLGFKKNMVYKVPPGEGGGVNHIQPVAYDTLYFSCLYPRDKKQANFSMIRYIYLSIFS